MDDDRRMAPAGSTSTVKINKDKKTGAMMYEYKGKKMSLNQYKYMMQEGRAPKINLDKKRTGGQCVDDKKSEMTGYKLSKR